MDGKDTQSFVYLDGQTSSLISGNFFDMKSSVYLKPYHIVEESEMLNSDLLFKKT